MPHPWITIVATLTLTIGLAPPAKAQVTAARKTSATPNRVATLEEQLVNRLRATTTERKAYIKFVVKQVMERKLEAKLVVAIERKAIQRNPYFPFPFFERAMRFEAAKRNVILPPVRQFATTKLLPDRLP